MDDLTPESDPAWGESRYLDDEEMFMHQFGINPRRVSCECCGQDFEVIELATGQGGS